MNYGYTPGVDDNHKVYVHERDPVHISSSHYLIDMIRVLRNDIFVNPLQYAKTRLINWYWTEELQAI